jgi:hypothetical protein
VVTHEIKQTRTCRREKDREFGDYLFELVGTPYEARAIQYPEDERTWNASRWMVVVLRGTRQVRVVRPVYVETEEHAIEHARSELLRAHCENLTGCDIPASGGNWTPRRLTR